MFQNLHYSVTNELEDNIRGFLNGTFSCGIFVKE